MSAKCEIARIDGLELAAVCDVVEERARAAAERWGVPAYTHYEQMLAEAACEAVAVATPSGLHPQHGILAARAGKHVICEKPMAISLTAADELVQACDDAGVHLFVVKQNRLNPPIQLLKRALDKGRFGRIYLANTTVRWTRPQEYYDHAARRGTWEFDGGAFMNQASPYVDLIQWPVGTVDSVMAKTATLARRIETEDTGAAVLKFRSGALGIIQKNYPTLESVSEVGHIWVGEFRGRKGRKVPQERRDWPQDGCQIEPGDAESAIVTKEIFEYEMGKANTFAYLGERVCYWEGYQRGLRRAYYGEVFGSQEEHERWMSFAGDRKRTSSNGSGVVAMLTGWQYDWFPLVRRPVEESDKDEGATTEN